LQAISIVNPDPDPAFQVNPDVDPETDQGLMTKNEEKNTAGYFC
jgi:hypothetical protein